MKYQSYEYAVKLTADPDEGLSIALMPGQEYEDSTIVRYVSMPDKQTAQQFSLQNNLEMIRRPVGDWETL